MQKRKKQLEKCIFKKFLIRWGCKDKRNKSVQKTVLLLLLYKNKKINKKG